MCPFVKHGSLHFTKHVVDEFCSYFGLFKKLFPCSLIVIHSSPNYDLLYCKHPRNTWLFKVKMAPNRLILLNL